MAKEAIQVSATESDPWALTVAATCRQLGLRSYMPTYEIPLSGWGATTNALTVIALGGGQRK